MSQRSVTALLAAVIATVVLLGLDLGTKSWVQENLSQARRGESPPVCVGEGMQRLPTPPVVLVDDYLELRYAENCGAAFGLLRSAPPWLRSTIFPVAAIVASLALFWMFVQGRGGLIFMWSVPLIASGALGNFFDRFRLGYVVDFIRFHIENQWEWPTFNVADITITIGVALLVLDGIRTKPPESEGEAAAADSKKAAPGA